MSNLKEAIVFAVIGLLVFLALFDVTAFVVDENLAAEICYRELESECGDNVEAFTCLGESVCVNVAPIEESPVLKCLYADENFDPILPPPPVGTNVITGSAVEVKSPTLKTVAETSLGLSDKTPGPQMPCQVVYLCACDKENDPCKVVGEFYESTLTIFTATAGGGPCVVEE